MAAIIEKPWGLSSLSQRAKDMVFRIMENRENEWSQRGPDPDYASTQEQISNIWRAILRMQQRPPGPNGDGIAAWHLLIASGAVVLTIVGGVWILSERMSSNSTEIAKVGGKVDTVAASVTDLKENLREEHDRITRLEERQLAAERVHTVTTP